MHVMLLHTPSGACLVIMTCDCLYGAVAVPNQSASVQLGVVFLSHVVSGEIPTNFHLCSPSSSRNGLSLDKLWNANLVRIRSI